MAKASGKRRNASCGSKQPGNKKNTGENTKALSGEEVAELLSAPGLTRPERMALEPRVLLDAAGVETASDLGDAAAAQQAENWQSLNNNDQSQSSDTALLEAFSDLPANIPDSNQVVFIDSAVEDIPALTAGISPDIEVIILDPDSDGVEQIASALSGRTNIDAIHVISHGRVGTLDLGSTKLTEASINGKHADEMEVIRASLSEDADFLIYGCNFGAQARGMSAVEALARATGADVAASEDLTGAANLGGDWDLETETGSIEAAAIAVESYAHVLEIDATAVSDDAFIRGNFVEAAISQAGTFGSAETPPAGYHDSNVAGLFGFIANPQDDNWTTYDGDFFMPGAPTEGFALDINGTNYLNQNTGFSAATFNQLEAVAGSITNVELTAACGQNAARVTWVGNLVIGAGQQVEVTRVFTVLENSLFVTVETTLRNTGTVALNNVFFSNFVDPDNGQANGNPAAFTTINTIEAQPTALDPLTRVSAAQNAGGSDPDGSEMSIVASDSRARVAYGAGNDASANHALGLGLATGSTVTVDNNISVAWDVGTLNVGESTLLQSAYLLGADTTEVINCLKAPDLVLDPTNSSAVGNGNFAADALGGGGAVNIAASDADANDLGQNDLSVLEITVGGVVDGSAEQFSIAGQTFPLDSDFSGTVTVGGVLATLVVFDRYLNCYINASFCELIPLQKVIWIHLFKMRPTRTPIQARHRVKGSFGLTLTDQDGFSSQTSTSTITVDIDTDGDGVANLDDVDDDNDGIFDLIENPVMKVIDSSQLTLTGTTLTDWTAPPANNQNTFGSNYSVGAEIGFFSDTVQQVNAGPERVWISKWPNFRWNGTNRVGFSDYQMGKCGYLDGWCIHSTTTVVNR